MLSHEPPTVPRHHWWRFLLRGLLALAFGILALAFPRATATEVVAFVATYVVADGVITLLAAAQLRPHFGRWWMLLALGVFSVAFALLAFLPLRLPLMPMVVVASLWWLLASSAQFFVARGQRTIGGSAAWNVLEGILSIALAVTALVWPLPVASFVVLFAWLGLFVGLGRVAVAFEIRSLVARSRPTEARG